MRWLIASCLLVAAAWAHADAVQNLERFFQTTNSLSGRFVQKVYSSRGTLISQSSGTFELQRPDRFRWSYLKPHEQILVSDGRTLWIYDRGLAQVTVRKVGQALGRAPIALLGGGVPLTKNYRLGDDGRHAGLEWVRLRPKDSQNSQFQRILIGLKGEQVREMILFDAFGHKTQIVFRDIKRNLPLPARDFRFVPPKGVEVVDMM